MLYSNFGRPLIPWTPADLFVGGRAGYWAGGYDPAQGRIWQQSSRTPLVTSFDQPIGYSDRAAGTVDALQATALSRPTSARHPLGGQTNLYNSTEDLTTNQWVRGGSVVAFKLPGSRWNRLVESSSLAAPLLRKGVYTFIPGKRYTFSACFRRYPGTLSKRFAFWYIAPTMGQVGRVNADFEDLVIGRSENVTSSFIWDEEFEAYRLVMTVECTAAAPVSMIIDLRLGQTITTGTSYQGDGVSGIETTGYQMTESDGYVPYQSVTSFNDIVQVGQPDVWNAYNDGGDALNATLSAQTYGFAVVDTKGVITSASISWPGSGVLNTTQLERQADVIVRAGAFTAGELAQLTRYWEARYKL